MAEGDRHRGRALGRRIERAVDLSMATRPARWSVATLVVALAYFVVFAATRDVGVGRLLVFTVRNVVPLALAAVAARAVLLRFVIGLSGVRSAGAHVVVATAFSLGWLWLLTVAAGIIDGASPTRFIVRPFLFAEAAEWQLFQGLFAYAALAALVMLESRPVVVPGPTAEPVQPTRLMVRIGDEIMPVEPGDVVSITGADDYAELVTRTGRHLVRTTLTEFTERLDPERFLRVHRSAIVNLDRVVRAEPAGGGRLTLHMEMGGSVQASRAGAKLVRERLV